MTCSMSSSIRAFLTRLNRLALSVGGRSGRREFAPEGADYAPGADIEKDLALLER